MIIAIDGPSGAGKSTVAKAVAKELGFSCLDTGAMYRAIAWLALKRGVSLASGALLGNLAEQCSISFQKTTAHPFGVDVLVDDIVVTQAIRTAEIDRAVSTVSAHPEVRRALVSQQQRIGKQGDYVLEGRDIGTTVFPDAEVKVFLTASDAARARRRLRQNRRRHVGSQDFYEVLADIRKRDQEDSSRETSPLCAAPDAIHIDSSSQTIDQVVSAICALARERMI